MGGFVALVRREPVITTFLVTATAALTVAGVVRAESYLWVYLPALVASIAIVVVIDRRWGPIPGVLLWLLSIWAVLHLAGGLLADPSGSPNGILYETWLIDGVLRWDQLVHGFGIGAATLTLIVASRRSDRPLLWGFIWGQVVGLVNETAENVLALFVENTRVGDVVNTAWDIGWNLIGGGLAVAWVARTGIQSGVGYRRPA